MNGEGSNQRVVTFLNREEVDFLDKIGKDALFSTGLKVSRAKLISWLIHLAKKTPLTGEGIKSETDFESRFLDVLRKLAEKKIPPATEGNN